MDSDQDSFRVVTKFGVIRGERHFPKHGRPTGTVQIIHGYFSSNRIGPNRLYVFLARHLVSLGFEVFRYDALGVGESDGIFEDTSFETELRDAQAVHMHIRPVRPSRQVLIGHSMGANIALRMGISNRKISQIIALSPMCWHFGGVGNLFNAQQIEDLSKRGTTIRNGLAVRSLLLDEWLINDGVKLAGNLKVPLSVFHGTEDSFYRSEGSEMMATVCRQGRFHLIEGADHNYLKEFSREKLYGLIGREMLKEVGPNSLH